MADVGVGRGRILVDPLDGEPLSVSGGKLDVNSTVTIDLNNTVDDVAVYGNDGASNQIIKTDSDGHIQVDVLSAPTTAVTGTFWQATQPVSLASVPSHNVTNAGTFAVQVDNTPTVNLGATDNAVLDSIKEGVVSASSITEYAQFDVDTSAIQLSSADGIDTATTGCKEIIIQCDFDNTGYVMVGGSSNVACDSRGIRLEAGDTLTLSSDATADVYLIASANDQMVNVMVLK